MVVLLGVSLVILLSVAVTLYSAVEIVEEGPPVALLVFGEMQAVLEPGLNFVPPFVSTTYPIDPQTMTMDAGDRELEVPEEYAQAVRTATSGGQSSQDEPTELGRVPRPRPTAPNRPDDSESRPFWGRHCSSQEHSASPFRS